MSMTSMFIQAAAQLPLPKDDLPIVSPDQVPPATAAGQVQAGTLSSLREIDLTLIVLIFGLLSLVLLFLMVRQGRTGEFELRIFIVTILVFGSLLVLSAGFGEEQLGPVIGFFGTIAGYILGRGDLLADRRHDRHHDRIDDRLDDRPREQTNERA